MAKRSKKEISEHDKWVQELKEEEKEVVRDNACEWVRSLLDANGSKYSEVSPATILGQENTELSYEEFSEAAKNPLLPMVMTNSEFFKVAVDIWCGCPLQVHTVYVYGKINGCRWRIYRDMILGENGEKLVWWTEDAELNQVWHGVEDFRFWEIPPYVEESGVSNEDLLDMNEPCWSW